ncbi:hypothetical protein BCV72DRAFT_223857 [Rhizopus microsporus var. microsporus]|uniref:Uncharacterized protein n=1 Tax=Rhizopus microsporus var. microsporus TaxID=86635 RepID=A0A1X0RAP6_RHIZD|nr:hypothetical protein BCV72DRAFT_223857 [Rhizopus microsporus var. microsporus]
MITKDTIQPLIDKDDKLPPLAALAHFIIAGKLSIIDTEHNDDETIQSLYRLAMDIFPCDVRDGDGFEPAITALNEMGQQFKKITKEIPSNPNRAVAYSEDGEAYCIKMKRKFDEAMDGNRAVTPMYESEVPKCNLTNDTTYNEINSQKRKDQLIKFVDEFKVALNGRRMNWHDCWKEGRSHGIITHYTNYEVMKNAYHRAKQQHSLPSL